ncbi:MULTISPECIES: pilus assembly protein [Shewanella]|uniref:PilC/PilY family type IV pilus protein n=1 Tax=Shewanella indica TaxID=768528 RepID=A0ABU4Q638_9GAMM|nr:MULTISPECIES: PilC/PilY family type IV pilus protein [Shewanella]MDX6014904.1 PilC/PilY family type IV pilus protein [Shewanella indica]NDO74104.1 type IV pilin biogenesis protein [Shewanella sp. SE1]BCV37467.1 type IV pili system adhesin PilY [Shewanella chilikensis]
MFNKLLLSVLMAMVVVSGVTIADDTELYLIDSTVRSGKRPQVLFIFDNSGSMSTEDENAISSYCSEEDYNNKRCTYADGFSDYLTGYAGYINEKGIYWNAGGIDNTSTMPVPDDPTESRRFYSDNNNCQLAADALTSRGRYTGYLREFKLKGNSGKWYSLADNEGFNQGQIVDCYEDILNENPGNPGKNKKGGDFPLGYPIDSKDMYTVGTDDVASQYSLDHTDFGKGSPVTLYTAHYLVWYEWVTTTEDGKNSGGTGTRLEVAKEALVSALTDLAIPIDAGLAVFNLNYPEEGDANGGRIVFDIAEMTDGNLASLTSLINGMPAQTNTPLCETLYEAYQYFSGGPVTYGNKDANGKGLFNIDDYIPNNPPSIISSGNYSSPFKKCPDTAYVIYITDGAPTLDNSANANILSLTSSSDSAADYSGFEFVNDDGEEEVSYFPALAAYMYNNDLVKGIKDSTGIDNKQNVRVFTIGFSEGAETAAALLEEAAFRGGNPRNDNGISKGYYVAKTGLDLVGAMDDALKSILSIDSSFTSPSIASNNFDKTQTYNSAYFAMFLPGEGPRWSGNLKKLKVNSSGEIVAPGGTTNAIDPSGNIAPTVCTYWNACSGNKIDGNKVNSGGVLPTLQDSLKGRAIKTNVGNGLVDLKSSSFSSAYSQDDLDWLYGVDVDDDDGDSITSEAREDIMGDPLHSKPLAINFGGTPDDKGENLDVRILIGTNQGLVHMFKDSDSGSGDYSIGNVQESWAFIPNELWGNVPELRRNYETGVHSVYGMDLSPIAYTETDSAGKVSKAWVYLGMRRGGSSYYSLDITNPDSPVFKWMINSDSAGFEELGESWSEPVITHIPGVSGPVLIIGGGMAFSGGAGNAIYIINAATGELIKKWSEVGMSSIPNRVAVLDSNNDGLSDRIYASDVSGQIWRVDMPSNEMSKWPIFMFASIATSGSPNDRMFFVEPVVAQTQFSNIHSDNGALSYQNIPYDAVAIGSGNRTHPLGTATDDMFYVFQDRNVVTQYFSDGTPQPLGLEDLYDVTSSAPASQSEDVAFGTKRGWFYNFGSSGEKSLSASLIFDGKVYFTSFVPPVNSDIDLDAGICGFAGQGRLYVFDLHKGTRSFSEVFYDVGERVPDTPQIVIPKPETDEDPTAYIIGVGKGECENGDCKGTISLGSGLTTNRIYYHVNE